MKQILKLELVSKTYEDAPALQEVSFSLETGEFAALAGPSGSGKTSLLNLISGLDRPCSGKIEILGRELGKLSQDQLAWLRRGKMGFIFQSYNLFPVLTALENVEYPLALLRIPPDERRARAVSALHAVGLRKYAHRRPNELSGGQQQRVAVARAVVAAPKLVLADEPTANLDSKSAASLVELFRELNESRGITFLFSSHDSRILKSAARVLEIADGRLCSDEIVPKTISPLPTRKRVTHPKVGLVQRVL